MNISVTIYTIHFTFSVWIVKVLLEGSMSHIIYLGPSSYYVAKKGNVLHIFAIQFFHKMKTRT